MAQSLKAWRREVCTLRRIGCLLILVGLVLAGAPARGADTVQPGSCTYDTYKWNATRMKAGAWGRVQKSYSSLTPAEVDPVTGCSVCSEDQVELRLEGLAPFRLCRHVAGKVEETLLRLQSQGVPIRKVVGYRVGMTRGDIDADGNRTRFSNHSFGIAVDINEGENGLYESCVQIGPRCRLRKGGVWDPAHNPLSMTADHAVVIAMKEIGLRWGGQLAGRQKDFMHFSPSGD